MLQWKQFRNFKGVATTRYKLWWFKTITVDLSKYNEFLLTIGTYPADQYRILSSTVIPKTALENMIGQDSNGYFQVRYSDYYWAGLDYLGNNKIRYRSSNNEGLATIWAR